MSEPSHVTGMQQKQEEKTQLLNYYNKGYNNFAKERKM